MDVDEHYATVGLLHLKDTRVPLLLGSTTVDAGKENIGKEGDHRAKEFLLDPATTDGDRTRNPHLTRFPMAIEWELGR